MNIRVLRQSCRTRFLWVAIIVGCLAGSLLSPMSYPSVAAKKPLNTESPELLSYQELIELSEPEPSSSLLEKVDRLRNAPFVSNAATSRRVTPIKPRDATLGRMIRVAAWNIERGLEYEAILAALSGGKRLSSLVDRRDHPTRNERQEIMREAAILAEADIIVLNEVDWGMKRTGYRNVVSDLATALRMNYAYGVEFIEVDPLALGTETFAGVDTEKRAELISLIKVDPARYKGLHGTAILSRFPLNKVRLIPFKHQPYDWYKDEKKGVDPLEFGKRKAGEVAFLEKITRQIRRGGRMMLVAEISDPDIPTGRMSIVATHLEARTKPSERRKQLEELLALIKDIEGPVILAGDMNTSTKDGTPTTIQREIKKRLGSKKFWLTKSVGWLTGIEIPRSIILRGLNEYRRQADPTVRHIPLVASNPEAEFFETLKEFRFSDGGAFDFRGERNRSINDSTETLANSNQRGGKGFITTYEVERTIGFLGRFKLDWIFVKPPEIKDPEQKSGPHQFAPHFGRTLKLLNYSIEDRISDHNPLIVDLPLGEPILRAGGANKISRPR